MNKEVFSVKKKINPFFDVAQGPLIGENLSEIVWLLFKDGLKNIFELDVKRFYKCTNSFKDKFLNFPQNSKTQNLIFKIHTAKFVNTQSDCFVVFKQIVIVC